MPKYPTSEYTKPHLTLHEELIRRFDRISVLSEQEYNSSYFHIEGEDKKFFVLDLLEKNKVQAFIEYVGRHKKDQNLRFIFKKFKFDIYFPAIPLDIEIDGESHKSVKRELKDLERDELLKEQGFSTWRIPNKDLASKKKILAVAADIEENVGVLMQLKAMRRKK